MLMLMVKWQTNLKLAFGTKQGSAITDIKSVYLTRVKKTMLIINFIRDQKYAYLIYIGEFTHFAKSLLPPMATFCITRFACVNNS